MEEMALPLMLEAMWAANVVDIETAVSECCSKVLFDKSVPKNTRKERALALQSLGSIFKTYSDPKVSKGPVTKDNARTLLQDAMMNFQQKKLDEEDP